MTMIAAMPVQFRLNGEHRSIQVAPETRLSAILRELLDLRATKIACSIGRCGACMVLMNGRAVNGCLVMAWQMEGADIVSPEGLEALAVGPILRSALAQENAFQCGYCAPGFSMSLAALFIANPDAGENDVRTALEGNICRCTGYHSIIRGALAAASALRTAGDPAEISGDHRS